MIPTGIEALDKVLGGGVIPGRMLLVQGPPGVGLTTLLLQACDGFAKEGRHAFFATDGTAAAVLDNALRVGCVNNHVHMNSSLGIDVHETLEEVLSTKSKLLVVDSANVAVVDDVPGDPGSLAMMAAVASLLQSFARKKNVAVLLVRHDEKVSDEDQPHRIAADGCIRLDFTTVDNLREISIAGKFRQGRSNATALIELTDKCFRSTKTTKAAAWPFTEEHRRKAAEVAAWAVDFLHRDTVAAGATAVMMEKASGLSAFAETMERLSRASDHDFVKKAMENAIKNADMLMEQFVKRG